MEIIKMLVLILLFGSACNNKEEAPKPDIAFEKTKWDMTDGENYIYRKQMINDLLKNNQLSGVKKDSVIRKLGEPDVIEEDRFMLYHYDQKHLGSFVLSTQSLVVDVAPDSTVSLVRTN